MRKDTSNVEAIFCISTWAITNGFDSQIFYRTYPSAPTIPEVMDLRDAFGKRFEEAMTQVLLGELPQPAIMGDLLAPVAFQVNGLDFSWLPPELPSSLPDH